MESLLKKCSKTELFRYLLWFHILPIILFSPFHIFSLQSPWSHRQYAPYLSAKEPVQQHIHLIAIGRLCRWEWEWKKTLKVWVNPRHLLKYWGMSTNKSVPTGKITACYENSTNKTTRPWTLQLNVPWLKDTSVPDAAKIRLGETLKRRHWEASTLRLWGS